MDKGLVCLVSFQVEGGDGALRGGNGVVERCYLDCVCLVAVEQSVAGSQDRGISDISDIT